MLRTWLEPEEILVPESFADSIGGNPLVSRVLFSRGMKDINSARGFLYPIDYHPSSPSELPNVDKTCQMLKKAISAQTPIGVWGDFDVDGQTSTTVFVSALREMGGNVIFHIPVRAEESHGIGLSALQKFIHQGVGLLLTCDTGITAHTAIQFAHSNSVPVIITDHHDLPGVLPVADAIVNPKMLIEKHPLSSLPGVGVVYKIVEELWHLLGDDDKPHQYLDLVALGIVADLALIKGDTRFLLQLGLDALRHTKRAGILAIMELAEVNQSNLTEEHIAFILAPRMNAIGRLDDANSIVELLTTSDMARARMLALELEGMNAQRKLLSDQIFQAAQAQLSADPKLLDYPVMVLSHPSWPAGVIGVVASRLVEQYHRPVLLFSAPPGKIGRGSARSIESVNITSAIAANQSFLKGFGGHPMAAGLSIDSDRIPDFRFAISKTVQNMGLRIQKEKNLPIDGYLTLPELTLELVEDLERLAPFGAGNPPLVFVSRNLKLTGYAAVGRAADHLQLTIEDELGYSQRSIWWQGAGNILPEMNFDLAYSIRASTYRGQRGIQIEWIDYQPSALQSISLEKKKLPIKVIDYRAEPEPLARLTQLQEEEKFIIWGETDARSNISSLDRFSLFPAEILAIWTIPPGPDEIQNVLQLVKPEKVYLFGINPELDQPEAFIKHLAGLMKSHLNSSLGSINLSDLAASTAQRISTIKAGVAWLDSHGYIELVELNDNIARIAVGTKKKKENANKSTSLLNSVLSETAAFRRYYISADKDRILFFEKKVD